MCDTSESDDSDLLVYIIIGVPIVACLLVILAAVIVVILCCHSKRSRRKAKLDGDADKPRYSSSPGIQMVSLQGTEGKGANPLYAVNPLKSQNAIDAGVKLPEFPRADIVYIRDLGQGHFGLVVLADAKGIVPGQEYTSVAIKVLKEGASDKVKVDFFKEASLMHAFDHPNIVKLLGVCIEQEPLCMIFEYMELGDLNNFLRKHGPKWGSTQSITRKQQPRLTPPSLSTQQLVNIAVDVAAGLEYLALNHYVHRDLATRNCLVNANFRVKISDFGLSQDIYSTDYFRLGDSELLPIRWMPPEAIMYAKFTTQSDVWSFGVVLWEIFSFGIQPYCSLTNEEVVQHVRDGNVLSCPDGCPQELYDLILDCWTMEPSERPTAAELHGGLARWNPELSATLQAQQTPSGKTEYQNMATIREYAMQPSTTDSGIAEHSLSTSDVSSVTGRACQILELSPDPPESVTSDAPLLVNATNRYRSGSPPRQLSSTAYKHTV